GAAVALVGIGQACLGLARTGAWTRAHAFVHPVTYGELMGFAALASLAWLCARDMRAQPAAKRRAAQLALAATLIALVLSGTRGAILGVFAGAFALSALPGRRWLALAAVPLAAASLLAADLLPQGATRSLLLELKGRQSGQSFRLVLWTAAADMFREKPWLGTGPGAFRSQLPRYSAAGLDGERSFGTAHNLYLHHLAERGALGLASTLWLLGAMAWGAWRRARDDADAPGLWAWCAAAAFPFMNLTEVALQTEQVWMSLFFIWFLALARPGATGEARGGA
ncbi:MAG: O-antigen ligase family protein, partial [Elusimicrobia bacterium]|nr:O-antigen ligase family protein [Elusimicrobiota bacterium]